MFDSLKITLWLSLVLLFLVSQPFLKIKCKEFSRIVCVSLFSYQGSLSLDSSFTLSHLFFFVKHFFQVFLTFPKFGILWDVRLIDSLFTLSCIQALVNNFFIFLKFFQKNNGEGGIWTLAPLLTTYSLSRGAPSASLGISPKRPLFNIHDSYFFVQHFFTYFLLFFKFSNILPITLL